MLYIVVRAVLYIAVRAVLYIAVRAVLYIAVRAVLYIALRTVPFQIRFRLGSRTMVLEVSFSSENWWDPSALLALSRNRHCLHTAHIEAKTLDLAV